MANDRHRHSRRRRAHSSALRRLRTGAPRIRRPRRGRGAARGHRRDERGLRHRHRDRCARRGPRALACARANIDQLGLRDTVDVVDADLFPAGRAALVLCNPPWVPARPSSPLEYGIYDPESRMLRGFLAGLATHLAPAGEGWLILSDLAEHLGLRTRDDLIAAIDAAAL